METLPGDPTDFFQVLEKLGEGRYGEVYSALDIRTGSMVAIKAIPMESDLSDIQKGSQYSASADPPTLYMLHGAFPVRLSAGVVRPRCAVYRIIREGWRSVDRNGVLFCQVPCDLMTICDITSKSAAIAEVLASVLRVWSTSIKPSSYHRDLKAGNILLTEDGSAKLRAVAVIQGG